MNVLYSFLRSRQRRKRSEESESDFVYPSVQETSSQEQQETTEENNANKNTAETPLPLLYKWASKWMWEAVKIRCSTNPEEASARYRDHSGDTVLHWTCFGNPPLEIVEALLKACPGLAKVQNCKGNSPLHVACSYRALPEVVRALVRAYPEGAGIPNDAKSWPLHIVCDYFCNVGSIFALLETTEGALSVLRRDRIFGRTPLHILNERKNLHLYHRFLHELRVLRQRQRETRELSRGCRDEGTLQMLQADLEKLESRIAPFYRDDFWQKARLLVLSQYLGRALSVDDTSRPGIIHACLAMENCPPTLLELAILLQSDELLVTDDQSQSRLPLHMACAISAPSVVSEVLAACTKAARIPDGFGRLPLTIFLGEAKVTAWSCTVENLILANPLALEAFELDERLFPLIWSRIAVSRDRISVLYESVRGTPSIFSRS
jgi:hypothetical protein